MTLKEELAEILELFKIDAENDHADTNITTQDILEAFNKIVPVFKSTITNPFKVWEKFGFDQCVDRIREKIEMTETITLDGVEYYQPVCRCKATGHKCYLLPMPQTTSILLDQIERRPNRKGNQ
jgi:hypothetical protein